MQAEGHAADIREAAASLSPRTHLPQPRAPRASPPALPPRATPSQQLDAVSVLPSVATQPYVSPRSTPAGLLAFVLPPEGSPGVRERMMMAMRPADGAGSEAGAPVVIAGGRATEFPQEPQQVA